jgi:CO dehydrogenase maturation factor
MSYIIAIAGKGGSGKTTIAALLIRLLSQQKKGSVLAVDADPNSNLGEVLGVSAELTVGSILDDIYLHPEKIPAGTPKERFIEYEVQSAVLEADGFDLLTMGRPEGPGCYCYVNNVMRGIVGKIVKDYDFVVIDNEAGLEHLSRRTTREANMLLVVSDATIVGIKAAQRIHQLVKELKIAIGKSAWVVNRLDHELEVEKKQLVQAPYIGNVPIDASLGALSLSGTSLFELDRDSLSLKALKKLGEKIWQS